MILTEDFVRQAASSEPLYEEDYSEFEMGYCEFDSNFDLFISHSYKDKEFISGLRNLFSTAGYSVYIDWIEDDNLDRGKVTSMTANLIRRRVSNARGMAYIATSNSATSKWCPWELGLADGATGNVCILPVMTGDFVGQEYLGLYPYLDYEKDNKSDKYQFWINFPGLDKRTSLKKWLDGDYSDLRN